MTHPPTPPPELVPQWRMDAWQARVETMGADVPTILLEIAQWGWDQRESEIQAAADAELEAIEKEIITQAWFADPGYRLANLRAARRPKPPSLKKQAVAVLEDANLDAVHYNTILRALEALPDD